VADLFARLPTKQNPNPLGLGVFQEEMIAATYRGSAIEGSETLEVTNPIKEQLCIDSVLFHFHSNTNKGFTLILENYQGRVYKTRITAGSTEHLIDFQPKEKFL